LSEIAGTSTVAIVPGDWQLKQIMMVRKHTFQ